MTYNCPKCGHKFLWTTGLEELDSKTLEAYAGDQIIIRMKCGQCGDRTQYGRRFLKLEEHFK